MKTSSLKKNIVLSAAIAALASLPNLHAAVTVTIEGGSASQSVLYDRATNLFAGGTLTVTGAASSAVRRFVGTSTNALLSGYGTITLDINVNNGAVNGLQALANQTAGTGDTNILGVPVVPTFVDSATSPEAVGIDSVAAHFNSYPTYVVPLVYIKNANSIDTAPITNLTQRQAVQLETATNSTRYFGGTSTNQVFFIGRNSQSAVRTEIDYNIYNSATILSFYTNSLGQATVDTNADPGLTAGGAVTSTVLVLTNAIGEVAVQNIKSGVVAIPYEGVPYSANNVINGSYPLWGYENYYFIATGNAGAPSTAQQAVIDVFYASVTNLAFQAQVGGVFTNNFIPNASLRVSRNFDGGPIVPLPNY